MLKERKTFLTEEILTILILRKHKEEEYSMSLQDS